LHDTQPSLAVHRPDLPTVVNDVLARAMEREPAKRYETCAAFAAALSEALGIAP
jgi:serine/threonine-protein kinase